MNQDSMKWILIAAGAFLLWNWLKNSTTAAQQSGSGSGSQPGSGTGSPPATTPPGGGEQAQQAPPPPPAPPDYVLMQAAVDASKAGLAGDYKLNWWQWNYYRMQGAKTVLGIADPDPAVYQPQLDLRLQVSADKRITASEYHQLLRDFGLSGLMWRSPQYWR